MATASAGCSVVKSEAAKRGRGSARLLTTEQAVLFVASEGRSVDRGEDQARLGMFERVGSQKVELPAEPGIRGELKGKVRIRK